MASSLTASSIDTTATGSNTHSGTATSSDTATATSSGTTTDAAAGAKMSPSSTGSTTATDTTSNTASTTAPSGTSSPSITPSDLGAASLASGSSTPSSTTGTSTGTGASDTATPATTSPVTTTTPVAASIPTPSPTVTPSPSDTVVPSLNAALTPSPTTPPPPPPTTPPQSLQPTGTDTLTSQSLPSTIVTQSLTTASQSAPTATSTGIPSSLPRIITPDGGVPRQPQNTTLIQVGFNYGLNYPFVVNNTISVAQIFNYLPQGLAYALDIPTSQVIMHTLQPYDTTKDLNYITTLALAFVPSDMVNRLELDLHTPASRAYNNPDQSTDAMMSMINPSFPIRAYQPLGGSGNGPEGRNAPGGTAGTGGAPFDQPTTNNNGGNVNPTTIGIGVGVVCGAAAYGAAMFFIARRYRRRNQRHRRSNSMMPHDQAASGPLMGGALMPTNTRYSPPHGGRLTPAADGRNSRGSGRSGGTSARNQQISAPMMAENSLGWN
ncbi:MAG: hypothetical protein M1823_000091 [Watsoniomyces obsoletus]|nr:MAG: hypothetical protein M1823_000091 [Watsoniomyces obsoletus]